jgi:hypothetical protein
MSEPVYLVPSSDEDQVVRDTARADRIAREGFQITGYILV